MSKITRIKGRSKMSKTELYENITKYFKTNYTYESDYRMYMEPCHIAGYCAKDEDNKLKTIFENQNFHIIDFKDLESLKDRKYDKDKVKELSFFFDDGVYHICDNEEYNLLVIESENYLGFIGAIVEEKEEEFEEFEFSLVNTVD